MRAIFILVLVVGCGGEDETAVDPPPASSSQAGLPSDMPCPPGEWLRDDGVCIPAGVPPDGCAEGFAHDGDRGCDAILPDAPCPPGLMAVVGERQCREVAPCSTARWGNIPVESNTEYVDASYAGMDSDGSALKPWTTIQAGVTAAASSAIVAIAAGHYAEDVNVFGKPVKLWGVCPAAVEVAGTGVSIGTVVVRTGANGTELHDLAVIGATVGVAVSGSLDVLLERVWVHDSVYRGVNVQNDLGPTRLTLRGSLLEDNEDTGLYAWGSEINVEASEIRGGQAARGVNVQTDPMGAPTTLQVTSSVVIGSGDLGVFIQGSHATIQASAIVRGAGRGVAAQAEPIMGAPSTLDLRGALIDANGGAGLLLGASQGTVEATVVRDSLGDGIAAEAHPDMAAPATLALRTSLVDRNTTTGVFVVGSSATLEAVAIRDTQPDAQGRIGRGLGVQSHETTGAPSTLDMRYSFIERSLDAGLFLGGSNATVEASVIGDTQVTADADYGRALEMQAHETTGTQANLLLHASLIENSHEAGVAIFGSTATIDACLLRNIAFSGGMDVAEGILMLSHPGQASATITGTHIHQSGRAAIAAWGAHASIESSAFSCQAFDFNTESYGEVVADLEDRGGNACGCPAPNGSCKAVSAGLRPPEPLGAE